MYGKQKVEKESVKESKKSKNLSTITKYFYIHVFCSLTDRQMEVIFVEQMLMYQINLHKKQASVVNSIREINVSIYIYTYIYAFCSQADKLTDKLSIEKMLINQTSLHKIKNQTSKLKSSFFTLTELQTNGQNVYRLKAHNKGKLHRKIDSLS